MIRRIHDVGFMIDNEWRAFLNSLNMRTLAIVTVLVMGPPSPAATVNLAGALVTSWAAADRGIETGAFTCLGSDKLLDCQLMEPAVLAWAIPTIPESLNLPTAHPLRQPDAVIETGVRNIRIPGMIPLHEAVRYILGSADEAAAARRLLENCGFGPKGRHYLLVARDKVVADGVVFPNVGEALAHLGKTKVDRALFLTAESSFPQKVPRELTYAYVKFQVWDGHK